MSKKAITDVESRTKKMIAERVTETADINERIELLRQQQTAARDAMTQATADGDVKAYQKAKADCRDAGDAMEMYNARLETLEEKPLISKGEYEKGVAQIMAALADVTADAKKQIVNHMEQIRVLAADVNVEIAKGNEVLHQWQHEVYKDNAHLQRMDGSTVHVDSLEKQYKDYSIAQFADFVLTSGYYKTIKG